MEQGRQRNIEETTGWLRKFGEKKITAKLLTRDVLVELIDKIYVFPEQEIDIHFRFANPLTVETERRK